MTLIRFLLQPACALAAPALLTLFATAACGDDERRKIPDDFCHGERDGVLCDDGDPCTVDDVCGQGVCLGRPALDCSGKGDGVCTVGVCDPDTVKCVEVPKSDGTTCDDKSLCTTGDACVAGTCAGAPVVCEGNPCAVESCDAETGSCKTDSVLDDGASCDDDDPCTAEGACQAGACVTEALDCDALAGPCERGFCDGETGCVVVTREDGERCEDGNPCTSEETCLEGSCGGATQVADGTECHFADLCLQPSTCQSGLCDAPPVECPPPPACYVATCDSATGACGTTVVEDGAPCDDRDACTSGETCAAGVCGSGQNLCFCRDKEDGTPCDDGQRCTAVDVCTDGACIGRPIDCSQLDDGRCMTGSCDPKNGECIAVPRPTGTSCDDGKACTALDRCVDGECVGDRPDCTGLDDGCNVGVCSEATGGCAKTPRPDDSACDDGDACSGGDVCKDGHCAGALDVCAACEGLAAGAPCDDGDPCTSASLCVLRGAALRCEGTPMDCSGVSTACLVGVCDPANGTCVTAPRPGLVTCDDGDACTQLDTCDDGFCRGSAIPVCGATVSACEPPGDDDSMARAVKAPPVGQTLTVLGWIDPGAEIDWWEIQIPAGVRLTIETTPHCGSELDTVIGLYDEAGALVAEDDNAGADGWSKVSDILTDRPTTFKLGVTSYGLATASYLINFTTEVPPPCRSDADCACSEYMCVLAGPTAGKCVPRMPAERVDDAAPETATEIALGGEVHGALADPSEVDWYALPLEAGVPVKIQTRAFCDVGLETQLSIYADDAVTELGYAFGNGPAGHSKIESFIPEVSGLYYVRVESVAATIGPYVLSVSGLRCTTDAQCACSDQVCDGHVGAPGECVPALGGSGSGTQPLDLGARMHGAIDPAYEVDSFVIALAAGRYDFETLAFCGEVMDTVLELRGPDGAVMAADEDGGEGFMAAIYGFDVPVAATYELRVSGGGPMVGDYLVHVQPAVERGP